MSRMHYVYMLMIVLLLALSSCRNEPAEAELPTPIATFTPAPTLPAVPTTSPTSAPPLAPTSVTTPTLAPAPAAVVVTATMTVSATTTVTRGMPTSEPTMPVTATVALTPTASPTREATSTPTSEPTTPPLTATQAPTATSAPAASNAAPAVGDLPAAIADLLPSADPAAGQPLTVNKGCTACHALEKGARLVGPSWYSVGATAGERVAGQSAEAYLYNSILHPNDYVVPDFLPNLMPANYNDLLSEQELAEIIAYLLTLQGE